MGILFHRSLKWLICLVFFNLIFELSSIVTPVSASKFASHDSSTEDNEFAEFENIAIRVKGINNACAANFALQLAAYFKWYKNYHF